MLCAVGALANFPTRYLEFYCLHAVAWYMMALYTCTSLPRIVMLTTVLFENPWTWWFDVLSIDTLLRKPYLHDNDTLRAYLISCHKQNQLTRDAKVRPGWDRAWIRYYEKGGDLFDWVWGVHIWNF